MAAMPRAREILGELRARSWPQTARVPESAATAPVMILIRVDLPAPFSPMIACTSPPRSSNETLLTAFTPPTNLVIQLPSHPSVACISPHQAHHLKNPCI